MAALAAALCCILPLTRALRCDLRSALHEGSRSTIGSRRTQWYQRALASIQVSISIVLLVGASLLFVSYFKVSQVDLGLNPQSVLTFRMSLSGSRYSTTAPGTQMADQ